MAQINWQEVAGYYDLKPSELSKQISKFVLDAALEIMDIKGTEQVTLCETPEYTLTVQKRVK